MINDFTNYMESMHSLFNDEFMKAYWECEPNVRRRVLPYLQAIYRRWYHATFIENVHFSPANIAATVGYYCNMPDNTHIAATLPGPASKLEKIGMKVIPYSLESHPVVADLKQLLKMCAPYIDLCEEWCFSDPQAVKIAKKLSLYDPYYASFLLEVAFKMELLTRMPSLYVQRAQVSETANAVLSLPNEDVLCQIIETVIEMTAAGLQGALPAPVPIFTEDGVRELLLNPLSTDEILDQAFSALGYDLSLLSFSAAFNESLSDDASEESDAAAELMSGIFVLGIMLDRLLFTPFGYFLRLIRPIYAMPFNVEQEISQYTFAMECTDDEFAAFFSPCTSYTLSDLGLQILSAQPTPGNYFDSRKVIPKDAVATAFVSPVGIKMFVKAAREAIPVSEMPNAVYTFCVYDVNSPKAWLHLQLPKSFTLHSLYEEVVDVFYADVGETYSFFHGKTENPFVEYVGSLGGERARTPGARSGAKAFEKHTNIPLATLDFNHVGEMILVVKRSGKQGVQKFAVQWLGEAMPDPQEYYPRISKLSDAAQKMLEEWENEDDFINFDGFDLD